MWWYELPDERYWVEIRRVEGLGTSLYSPDSDKAGKRNAWYDLLLDVKKGDTVYHYNARESRFVGRSIAMGGARHNADIYEVDLEEFSPIVATVDLATLREKADEIYALRDRLATSHRGPLYLPFQFTRDRSNLRPMSNYFAKMPRELVQLLFGVDGLGHVEVPVLEMGETITESQGPPIAPQKSAFLDPFKPKADTAYVTNVVGGRMPRSRSHETLVNDFEAWLRKRNLRTGRNAAIDLGTLEPEVIIEAKSVKAGWSIPIRQAIGQLYEYRYFKVASPRAGLIFLADKPVPPEWVKYLEDDRGIGAAWQADPKDFELSRMALKRLGL